MRDDKVCDVQHVPSKDNLADFFTKRLAPQDFVRLRDQHMVAPPAGVLGALQHFGINTE